MIRNKKAGKMLGETTVEVVVAILVALLLTYLAWSLLSNYVFKQSDELRIAETQFEKIVVKVNQVNLEGVEGLIDDFAPPVGWYFKSFPDYDYPSSECERKDGCLCMCEDEGCESTKKVCKGFGFDVQINNSYLYETIYYHELGTYEDLYRSAIIKFENAIEPLVVYKEGDVVKLKKKDG
jgi:hypothetical protein